MEVYQKKTQLEHVLIRPDSYVGSCEAITQNMWIVDPYTFKLEDKKISKSYYKNLRGIYNTDLFSIISSLLLK